MPAGTLLPLRWGICDTPRRGRLDIDLDSSHSSPASSQDNSTDHSPVTESDESTGQNILDGGWLSIALASNLNLSCASSSFRLAQSRAATAVRLASGPCCGPSGCYSRDTSALRHPVFTEVSYSTILDSTTAFSTKGINAKEIQQVKHSVTESTLASQGRRRSAGILRVKSVDGTEVRVRSKSEPSQQRSVYFSDTKGLPLVHAKEPDDWPCLDHESPTSPQAQLSTSRDSTLHVTSLELKGAVQPMDCADFKLRLLKQQVCLERVDVTNERHLRGIVHVMNIDYLKKVVIRLTEDSWHSFVDIEADFCDSRGSLVDRFSFAHVLSLTRGRSNVCEFAVCYQVLGKDHWDSNNGRNYVIHNRLHH